MYQISRLNGVVFNFLDKKDVRFKELHNTIEFICSTLHSQGLGSSVNSAAAVSVEDEEQLLDKEVLSMDNSTNLHYIWSSFMLEFIVYVEVKSSKVFRLINLLAILLMLMNNDENTYYLYTEFISKKNQHRFKDIHSKNKSVRVYATVGSRKCFVHLLEYYLDKLPPDPKAFYLCPLAIIPDDSSKPWFSNVPVAINTLHNLMKKVSEKGELAGKYTNHSLRATSASRLFAANVPEPCWS